MKKSITIIAIIMAVMVCAASYYCSARNVIVTLQELPQQAQSFLAAHFDTSDISSIVKDGNEYEVRFENGTEVEFNHKGQWENIDCKREPVPASIIALLPEQIPSYLKTNFKKAFITKLGKEHFGYDLELSNGLDLEFSSNGRLKKVDD